MDGRKNLINRVPSGFRRPRMIRTDLRLGNSPLTGREDGSPRNLWVSLVDPPFGSRIIVPVPVTAGSLGRLELISRIKAPQLGDHFAISYPVYTCSAYSVIDPAWRSAVGSSSTRHLANDDQLDRGSYQLSPTSRILRGFENPFHNLARVTSMQSARRGHRICQRRHFKPSLFPAR
jgi:hypothetical protein